MLILTIVIHKNNERQKNYTLRGASGYDLHYDVYDKLTDNGIDELMAIECASWCELAEDGETYNEEDFDVYVECR